ncbi:MAG: inner membrane CreD family protein [Verrucomicrobiales bacterium]
MTLLRLAAIAVIFIGTAVAWIILGTAMQLRTGAQGTQLASEVTTVWGPALRQSHPTAYYRSAASATGKKELQPTLSKVTVDLRYEPKQRGLLWYRTYAAKFSANYEITNPTPVTQTVYVRFELPTKEGSFHNFSFTVGDAGKREALPENGAITQAVSIAPGASAPVTVAYDARGKDAWRYDFGNSARVRQFSLLMTTDFADISFPVGTGSPTRRERAPAGDGWTCEWSYPDVISAPAIGMDMPKVLNAGPVASRIAFFAPVSLLFFFAVLIILGMRCRTSLHPMNYFFLAAGFFAFHLLFSYLVDQLPLLPSFIIASVVSLVLVCGYIAAVGGKQLLSIAAPAQAAYMVLFSYSFFFDGLTGLTITIGAIATLALLMIATARVNWAEIFKSRRTLASGGAPTAMPQGT